jgi:hypothetical protein
MNYRDDRPVRCRLDLLSMPRQPSQISASSSISWLAGFGVVMATTVPPPSRPPVEAVVVMNEGSRGDRLGPATLSESIWPSTLVQPDSFGSGDYRRGCFSNIR